MTDEFLLKVLLDIKNGSDKLTPREAQKRARAVIVLRNHGFVGGSSETPFVTPLGLGWIGDPEESR
jgi:hypothetical protein